MPIRLKGPKNHGGLSIRGVSYSPDKKGVVEIPAEDFEEALAHGFSHADQDEELPEKLEKPAAATTLKK